jgi:two-component system cell cycle response regulator CtrA
VDTPVLILSAMAEPDDKIKGLGYGANDYLTKPFERGDLIDRIHALAPPPLYAGASRTLNAASATNAAPDSFRARGRLNLTRTDMLEFLSLW